MEQHAVPRQITTFEFKLIGFMTLKQFIYLLVFIPLGVVAYFLFPIPILNILVGVLVGSLGLIFAFVPIYDRPADVWVRNLYKRLTKPTQFLYKKTNPPIYFLNDLFFVSDPHQTLAHVESQEKLKVYLAATNKTQQNNNQTIKKKQTITALFQQKLVEKQKPKVKNQETKNLPISSQQQTPNKKLPFLTGVVKNHKLIDLPGILIYIKNNNNQTLRLLKTNPHGVFATFSPLPPGEYLFEIKDPNNNYFFDTMKIKIDLENHKPINIFSKELI